MRPFFFAFAVTAVAFLVQDAIWLTLTAQRLYRPAIGHLMRENFDVLAAAAFYIVYIAGMVVFVVLPSGRTGAAAIRGACFGLVAYATYDLTNQATLRDWPWLVTAIDLCWGAFATAVACAIAHRAGASRRA